MPTYEYQCEKCKKVVEVDQRISDSPLTGTHASIDRHSKCKGNVKRLISGGSAFVLKGGGWAKDGY